jgi:hypothetical protein
MHMFIRYIAKHDLSRNTNPTVIGSMRVLVRME